MARRLLHGWTKRLLAVAALSAVSSTTAVTLASPDSRLHSLALSPAWPDGYLVAAQQGLLRSSRAIYTFALNSFDYKYSLRDYEEKSAEYYSARAEVHLRAARRLLHLCEANRGFYIKAGQFLASMQNIPKEYVSTLSVLQDQAQSRPFQAIERVIVGEFCKDVLDIFAEFDKQPIAAASLAQVHRALLKDGQEVAVKVQYPQLQKQFEIDVSTMAFLSKAVSWLFPDYQFEWLVPEFEKSLSRELDFVMEGKNAERTAKNFANKENIRIPHIKWDFTTTRVLTMEFMNGCKVDDVQSLKKAGIDPVQVAELLVEVFAEMVFCHGFVHGDPHPGNILVHKQNQARGKRNFDLESIKGKHDSSTYAFVVGGGDHAVLLDHGLYRELNEEFRSDYCRLWKALILLDPNEMQEVGDRLGAGRYYQYLPVIFTGRAIGSKLGLGQGMTSDEKQKLKAEVQHFTIGDISEFMEGLPRDFLIVLRTDGLLRSITSVLGAAPRMRLMTNAKYAAIGHRGGPDKKDQGWQAHTKALFNYASLRFRLEVFELSYRFGVFYGSLLQQVHRLLKKTLGKVWKIDVRTV